MPTHVIHTRLSRRELRGRLAALPQVLSGRAPDPLGIGRGFLLRLAVAFLSKIKLAFIVKARGGTDEAGISWPPLSKKYLAYGRGPKSTRTAGKLAPGGKDGFMSKAQLQQWRRTFARNLAWLAADMPLAEAKARAASIAWAQAKRAGVRTKLDVFGNREVEILRDRGLLFNSLSPGVLVEQGASAQYAPPENQIVDLVPGAIAVGSNVEYFKYHLKRRPVWPKPEQIPASWHEDMNAAAKSGLPVAIELIARAA